MCQQSVKWLNLEESAEELRELDCGCRVCNSEADQEHVARTVFGRVVNSRDERCLQLWFALDPLVYLYCFGFGSLR